MIVKKRDFLNVLLLCFLLKPVGLDNYSIKLNAFMNVFRLCSIILINIMYFATLKKRKMNLATKYILIIEVFVLISCLINKSSMYNAFVYWHSIISLILLAEINHNDSISFYKCLLCTLIFYVLVNFLGIIILLLKGVAVNQTTKFILGAKNMPILYIFPSLILLFLLFKINNNDKKSLIKKYMCIIFFIICGISIYYTHSATSLVVIVLTILYGIFLNNKMINIIMDKINSKVIFYIMLLFFILLVVVGVQKYFSTFIVNILGRDLTFTGRTVIWNKAIEIIKIRPYGYGWDYELTHLYSTLFWQKYFDVTNAHNFILNLAYKSGIITACIYILYLFKCSKMIDKKKEKYSNILKFAFLIYLLMTTFESYMSNFICMMFLTYIFINNDTLECEKNEK